MANAFAFKQLHRFKSLFIVYAFDELEKKVEGTEKSKQRWEQCLGLLFNNFAPVVQSLYASKYYDINIQKSAMDFTKEVVQDYIAEISDEADEDIIEKLNSIDYVIGYPKEVSNLKKIEEFYDELDLDGTEGFVATFLEMENYDQKIRNNPSSDWKRKLQVLCIQYDNKYFAEYNILCKLNYQTFIRQFILLFYFRCSSNVDTLSYIPSKSFSIFQHSWFIC